MSNFFIQHPICEGKTKAIFFTSYPEGAVLICSKDDVTALDGGKRDSFPEKGELSNEIACMVFRLLFYYGIKSHFIRKASASSFIAKKCEMVPIEVVVRRVASGSYLKRHLSVEKGLIFEEPIVEFFHKDDALHDPYINIDGGGKWYRHDPKKPIDPLLTKEEADGVILQANNAFVLMEWVFKKRGYDLLNFKLEFGRDCEGNIILADVLTPDEWILVKDGVHYDKQPFRDGAPASALRAPYKKVAEELTTLVASCA